MAKQEIFTVEECIKRKHDHLIIDVRSPSEFEKGHIPGAFSLPLFSNEERAIIGTIYKQQGKHPAMLEALNYYGKNVQGIVKQVLQLKQNYHTIKDNPVIVHCWRGGLRSAVVCWMLNLFGIDTIQLKGGYKAFRRYVLNTFEQHFHFRIIGGNTGSNKTKLLQYMKSKGLAVIDIESLAHHRGSAFGALGQQAQPSQEHFENMLANELWNYNTTPIWIEDESQAIGKVILPNALWNNMRASTVYYLDVSNEIRLRQILNDYGNFSIKDLQACTVKLTKKLGRLNTQLALQYLEQNNLSAAFEILLNYYDKLYSLATSKRTQSSIIRISCADNSPEYLFKTLLTYIDERHS